METWRKTMPLAIEWFRASDAVQEMSGAERAGLLSLLMVQWQAEDGYLPASEDFMRRGSRLGREWPAAKDAIMRMFSVCGEGVAEPVHRAAWEKAKSRADKQRAGGVRGNQVFWGDRLAVAKGAASEAQPNIGQEPLSLSNQAARRKGNTKAKGSVIPASARLSDAPEKKSDELGEIAQLTRDEPAATEAAENGSEHATNPASDANSEPRPLARSEACAPRQELKRLEEAAERGEIEPVRGVSREELIAAGVLRNPFVDGPLRFSPTEGEKQGAEGSPASQQTLLEAPMRPFSYGTDLFAAPAGKSAGFAPARRRSPF